MIHVSAEVIKSSKIVVVKLHDIITLNINLKKLTTMKTRFYFILALVCILLSSNLNAQMFAGGNLNLSVRSTEDQKTTGVNFNPEIGYFFSDNFALGGELIININNTKYDSDLQPDYESRGIGLGGFARLFAPEAGNIRLFGHAYGNIIFYNTNDISSVSLNGGVRPAIEFSLKDNLKLDIMAGNLGLGIDVEETHNVVNLNLRLNSLGFGLIYFF